MELVSVIMPAFNSERYIAESIESVLAQTYENWELIIVDDGSTDDTGLIAKHYAGDDKRIKYIRQDNQKQGKARNIGISFSGGDLIAFLDSDDLWIPEKLETQISYLINNDVDLVFSNGYVFMYDRNNTNKFYTTLTGIFQGDEAIALLLEQNFVPIPSVLTTKQAIIDVGKFNENTEIQNVEDYHLWLKMLLQGFSFYGMPEKLFFYRQHESQITTNDPYASEKVIIMLDQYVNIPPQLIPAFKKAKLIWGRNWYNFNAVSRKSANDILAKMAIYSQLTQLAFFTKLALTLFGVNWSKRLLNKLFRSIV